MDARQQLQLYVNSYKQASDAVKPAPSAPSGKKDLTEKALAILRRRGVVPKAGGKEAKCAKCGNAVSKCACGKKC